MRKPAVSIQEALGANQLPHRLICATPFEAIPNLKPFYNSPIYIGALELLRVITEYLVSLFVFFNYGCYEIIYYSFLVISRQISILN